MDSSGLHFYFTLQKSPGQDSPADSTGHTSLDSRRVQSGTVHQTYIGYVCCMFLESGPVRRIPPDTPLWTPLPFLTPEESSPAQSGGLNWIPLSRQESTFILVESSRVWRMDHVTICDTSGSTVTPIESSGVRRTDHVTICDPSGLRMVRRSPVGHVGQCKVLHLLVLIL